MTREVDAVRAIERATVPDTAEVRLVVPERGSERLVSAVEPDVRLELAATLIAVLDEPVTEVVSELEPMSSRPSVAAPVVNDTSVVDTVNGIVNVGCVPEFAVISELLAVKPTLFVTAAVFEVVSEVSPTSKIRVC